VRDQEAHDAGHGVALAMPETFGDAIDRLGFRWLEAGLDQSFPEYARFIEERNRQPGRERARFIRAAERTRDEMATLLEPDHVVALLERLAAEKQPIIASR
jgi:hypothetical protein